MSRAAKIGSAMRSEKGAVRLVSVDTIFLTRRCVALAMACGCKENIHVECETDMALPFWFGDGGLQPGAGPAMPHSLSKRDEQELAVADQILAERRIHMCAERDPGVQG